MEDSSKHRSWDQVGKHSKALIHALNTKTNTHKRQESQALGRQKCFIYWVPGMPPTPPASAFREDEGDDLPLAEKWVRLRWLPLGYWLAGLHPDLSNGELGGCRTWV